MNRSVQEIKARCTSILGNKEVIDLVGASSSPTAAYDMIFAETNNIGTAKAGRWLAILRRDFPKEYSDLSESMLSHVTSDTAQPKETQS